jgi:hypothetical protein
MLTTLLEPYPVEHESICPHEPDGPRGQGVSFYAGYDAEPGKLLEHPCLYAAPQPEDQLMKWFPNDKYGHAAFSLWQTLTRLNHTAAKVYKAHQTLEELETTLSRLTPDQDSFAEAALESQVNLETYSTGLGDIVRHLHFFCSSLLFRANQINNGSARWPKIADFKRLYELLGGGDPEAESLREIIFKNDNDWLMEKLVVEAAVMYDLLGSINVYTRPIFGGETPALVLIGPPKDRGFGFLVHNHALPQIMAGLDVIINRLDIFGLEHQAI